MKAVVGLKKSRIGLAFIALAVILGSHLANAQSLSLSDLNGVWEETGYQCAGDPTIHPRDNANFQKFFTLSNGTYVHRVDVTDWGNCTKVQSSGLIQGDLKTDRLAITLQVQSDIECSQGGSTLVDDYVVDNSVGGVYPITFTMRLETINEAPSLIVSEDPHYDCGNAPADRVFTKR